MRTRILLLGSLLLASAAFASLDSDRSFYIEGPTGNRFNLGIGFGGTAALGSQSVGQNTLAGFLAELQYAIDANIAIGLQVTYATYGTDTSGGSAVLVEGGLHYYSKRSFGGLWLHGGVGNYFVSTTGAGNFSALAIRGTIGWRWHAIGFPASCGLAFGPETYLSNSSTGVGLAFRFDAGFDFPPDSIFY